MSKNSYVLAQAYAGVQFWNADKSDLIEIRRPAGQQVVEIPSDIPEKELDRLVGLGAVVKASEEPQEAVPALVLEEPAGNASRDDWAAFADSLGLTVEAGSGREDIKQLVADSRG